MPEVNVSIVNNEITVDPPTLPMSGRGSNVQIQWNLTTPGWTFPSNGIVIDNNDGQFTQLRPIAGGSKFLAVDANSNSTLYKYMVNVTNGRDQLALDPYIQNGSER